MDHELKQRLIGAIVVTALCAIFIPMLFDDPVDNSGQTVSELSIPAPSAAKNGTASKLPGNAEQVLKSTDPEPVTTEPPAEVIENAGVAEEMSEEPDKERSGESLYAESEGYANADEGAEEPDASLKSHAKQVPLTDATHKNLVAKAPAKEIDEEALAREPVKAQKALDTVKPAPVKEVPTTTLAKEAARPTTPVKRPEYEAAATTNDVAKQAAAKPINSAKSLAAAVAEAKKPEAPKPASKMVRWYIQLGSFSKKENAISLWDSLREQGLPASMDAVQTEHGTTYRLRVGPELDGKKAAAMKARLDRQNIKAILISE
ncbi:MAG: SPOR domain-containing protein [Methylobacter sp.]